MLANSSPPQATPVYIYRCDSDTILNDVSLTGHLFLIALCLYLCAGVLMLYCGLFNVIIIVNICLLIIISITFPLILKASTMPLHLIPRPHFHTLVLRRFFNFRRIQPSNFLRKLIQ